MSCVEVFRTNGDLKNLAKFTGNHLCSSHPSIRLQVFRIAYASSNKHDLVEKYFFAIQAMFYQQ